MSAGLRCPKCGERTKVTDSRVKGSPEKAHVYRRRKCRKCGMRFSTYEVRVLEIVGWEQGKNS